MSHDKIKKFLHETRAAWIDWSHNALAAAHIGGVWERQVRTATNILEGLLRTYSLSLNNESIRTLVTEFELIVNSRLLIVEILNDTNSPATMLPINLLTLESTVIMSPNREFNQPECRRILEQVEKWISGGWGWLLGGGEAQSFLWCLGLALVFVWLGAPQWGFDSCFGGAFCWYWQNFHFGRGTGRWATIPWGLGTLLIFPNFLRSYALCLSATRETTRKYHVYK